MNKNRTPFDILGVTPADDMSTIRLAWRAKVRVLHPDLAVNKARATAELAEVNAAFDALQGHIPKQPRKQETPRNRPRPEGAKPRPSGAHKTTRGPAPRPAEPRAERVRPGPATPMSNEDKALSKRARAGYARALNIVAAA